MISLKHFLLLVVFILPYGCTDEYITNESNLGNIKGRVFDQTGYIPQERVIVRIPGTSVYAYTDSSGNFLLMNLPAGIYNLEVSSQYYPYYEQKINNISVSSGNTTVVPDILLETGTSTNPDFLQSLYIISPNSYDLSLSMNDTSLVDLDFVGGDTLLIRGRLSYDYYHYQVGDTALTVEYDSDLYYVESSKREFYLYVPVKAGFCQIQVWEGHSTQPNNASFISTILVTEKISTRIDLWWITSYGNSAGDFDIHLINNELQDSCWYLNQNPDWGIIGLEEDNPDLDDYTNPSGQSYCNENLYINFTPDGTYKLKVVYFSNIFNDTIQIASSINLNIDGTSHYYAAPSAMSVGQVWTVLEFNMPSKTVIPINTIGRPVSTGFVRK